MIARFSRRPALWTVAFVLPLLAGCGGPRTGTVVGIVKIGDTPVTAGTIMFISAEGGDPVAGPINPDGTYRVENVPAGRCLVTVMDTPERATADLDNPGLPVKEDPGMVQKRHGQQTEANAAAGIELPAIPDLPARKNGLVPDWYKDPGTSGLSVEVNSGRKAETQYDITLTTEKPAPPPG